MKNKKILLIILLIILFFGIGIIAWQCYYGPGIYNIIRYKNNEYQKSSVDKMTLEQANAFLKVTMKPTGKYYRGREIYSVIGTGPCPRPGGCGELIILLKEKDNLFQSYDCMCGP